MESISTGVSCYSERSLTKDTKDSKTAVDEAGNIRPHGRAKEELVDMDKYQKLNKEIRKMCKKAKTA